MRPRRTFVVALLGALTLAGCGHTRHPGAPAPAAPAGAGFPVTVHTAAGPVTIPARPRRIVSLSPTSTEMLYAVGAGSQVVAVDDQSDYPAQAPRTKLSGFKPNAEAVIGYSPDLVVLSDDANGIVAALKAVKIPVLQTPAAATLDDTYREIAEVGAATGHAAQAAGVVAGMKRRIAQIVAATRKPARPLTYYHELESDLYTVTSKTFVGQVYGLFGLRNIADKADKQGSGYPRLSAEYVVQADPDLIFLADTRCCGQSRATVARRPGWNHITAVRDGQIVELDDDIASRWGPRVVDFVQEVAQAVNRAAGSSGGR